MNIQIASPSQFNANRRKNFFEPGNEAVTRLEMIDDDNAGIGFGNPFDMVEKTLRIGDNRNHMADEDVMVNRKIGEYGSKLISDGDTVLTHCNAGRLATVDYGTALAVIRAALPAKLDLSCRAPD